MTALWICLGVIAMLAIWAVTIYNRLVKLRNNRENAFADIDVQLKQRHDLVPQLVATVKGYAAHEQETLEKVIAARNGAVNASTINDKEEISDVENKLAAVRRYFNSATKELNNAVETFPSNIFAGMFGFRKEMMFDLGEQRQTLDRAPEIKF